MISKKIGIDYLDDTSSSQIKYELNESEVLDLYYSEPRLATLMDLDVIRLVDHHLVVNLNDFITPKTNHLTANAKRHLSACCVGIQYINEEFGKSHQNAFSCTLDILIQSSVFLESSTPAADKQSEFEQNKESALINKEIDRLNKIINELPGSFSGSLKSHMERKGYTEELLAQESWVSLSTIKQYRQKEDKEKTLKTVTALCIGLHLHPWLTEDLLRKAGIVPKATKQDGAYRYLYTVLYKGTIEECNKYLHSQHLQEFTLREKTA